MRRSHLLLVLPRFCCRTERVRAAADVAVWRRAAAGASGADSADAAGAAAGPCVAAAGRYYQQPCAQPYAAVLHQQPMQPCPMPQPRLFHEEMQPDYGLMVAGLVIFGASWSINAASAYARRRVEPRRPRHRPVHGDAEHQHSHTAYTDVQPHAGGPARVRRPHRERRRHHARCRRHTHHKVRVYERARGRAFSRPLRRARRCGLAAFGSF